MIVSSNLENNLGFVLLHQSQVLCVVLGEPHIVSFLLEVVLVSSSGVDVSNYDKFS